MLITLPVPLLLKWVYPALPFLDNMVVSFVIICGQMIIVSLFDKSKEARTSTWELPAGIFRNSDVIFKWLSVGIILILIALYSVFW